MSFTSILPGLASPYSSLILKTIIPLLKKFVPTFQDSRWKCSFCLEFFWNWRRSKRVIFLCKLQILHTENYKKVNLLYCPIFHQLSQYIWVLLHTQIYWKHTYILYIFLSVFLTFVNCFKIGDTNIY